MESAVTLSVPLKVDIHSGQNWMEAKWQISWFKLNFPRFFYLI
jgi:hypothetical protein